MTERLYARLREDVNIRLRRGAWYRVLKVEGLKAILEVNGRHVLVASALLEIVKRPPPRWTVVTQDASGARKAPPALAERYGVCPSCTERAPLAKHVRRLRCPYCKYEFEVAWDEAYLV
jgi:ribosomal protein S27AE